VPSSILNIELKAKQGIDLSIVISEQATIESQSPTSGLVSFIATGERGSPGIAGTPDISDGDIGTIMLANYSVTNAKIGPYAVTEGKIQNGSITYAKIASGAISTPHIVDGSITAVKLSPGLISYLHIEDGSIIDDKYKDDSISEIKIKDSAITASKIADGHITYTKLAVASVRTFAIDDDNVTEAKLELPVRLKISDSKSVTDHITVTAPVDIDAMKLKLDGFNSSAALLGAETEIDFGALPVYEKEFTISNSMVVSSSKIIASLAYEAPTGKDLDEIGMDMLYISCGQASAGSFTMFVKAIDGSYLEGAFKINYSIT
tara:strand:+ start:45920 stop:46876 length:957 start_codon:yes stop_codon:yes gene_type:complete